MTPRPVLFIVTLTLAASTIICLGLVGWLATHNQPVPDVLVTITGGLVGSMSTILVRTGTDEPPNGATTTTTNAPTTVTVSTDPES